MAEGLTPSESAKELEHHRHAEQGTHGEHRREVIAILEAVLLSVVTIVTAWAGYSAAKWGTESRLDLAHGSALRIEANRAFAVAEENRNFDSSTFNAWFIAYTLGNTDKMEIAERRFRPEFRVAFDAWRATDPDHNPSAPPGPTYMPQYRQPEKAQANQLDGRADAATASGYHSASVADNYVRITVLLATVLFLVGIGSTFAVKKIRVALASVGAVMLVTAVALIAQQPRPR
ncbi:hypothetical protein EV644_11649 [Kribbella orskensis]|uniref:DUF4337 domain-containing protein n=1 Tax=Kribbella orskensis TaxID=2512216 RepID=A0ABY2BDG9_9ACTN|nr:MULTISPECIES: hypothetical protein [Kribbella]TCN35256.1 hypothetical protein EV642_11749 [Kribbella sp. VKM Ac-2500]TCO16678.1 hypothetical protein EV644_11649 [Kribbella orskensis]